MPRRRGKKNGSSNEPAELNLLPLMSLFVALVPTLLYTAVFVPVTAIGLDFPGTGGVAAADQIPITVRLTDSTLALEGIPDRLYQPHDRRGEAAWTAAVDTLAMELGEVHSLHPSARGALLVVSPDVTYLDVVRVMDVVREKGLGNSTLLGAAGAAEEPAAGGAP